MRTEVAPQAYRSMFESHVRTGSHEQLRTTCAAQECRTGSWKYVLEICMSGRIGEGSPGGAQALAAMSPEGVLPDMVAAGWAALNRG